MLNVHITLLSLLVVVNLKGGYSLIELFFVGIIGEDSGFIWGAVDGFRFVPF